MTVNTNAHEYKEKELCARGEEHRGGKREMSCFFLLLLFFPHGVQSLCA